MKYQPVLHDHKAFLKKARKRRGFQAAYDALAVEYAVVNEMLTARSRAGLTQKVAAARRGTTKCTVLPFAENVTVSVDTLCVDLSDGRSISVPLAWYPRLLHATAVERKRWRLIGRGSGIHWEHLDEDISVEGLLAGKPSGESQASFSNWLAKRPSRQNTRSARTRAKAARVG